MWVQVGSSRGRVGLPPALGQLAPDTRPRLVGEDRETYLIFLAEVEKAWGGADAQRSRRSDARQSRSAEVHPAAREY